jgi:hypothetical protein
MASEYKRSESAHSVSAIVVCSHRLEAVRTHRQEADEEAVRQYAQKEVVFP